MKYILEKGKPCWLYGRSTEDPNLTDGLPGNRIYATKKCIYTESDIIEKNTTRDRWFLFRLPMDVSYRNVGFVGVAVTDLQIVSY